MKPGGAYLEEGGEEWVVETDGLTDKQKIKPSYTSKIIYIADYLCFMTRQSNNRRPDLTY